MAEIPAVSCPKCQKRFRPKAAVPGRKINCPFCEHPFAMPAVKATKEAKEAKSAKEAKAAKNAKPAPVVQAAPVENSPVDEFEADTNPYGVKNQDMTPRCPNCAKALANENAIICLFCGYNSLTRTVNRTEKTIAVTFEQHFKYLLPALGAAAFAFGSIIFLLYYSILSPYDVDNTMFEFTDHESMRMWTTVIFLGWVWGAGMFCFKKFIEKPKPDEISNE